MRQQMTLEIKVGAFIVTGVALLVFLLFAIGDLATYFQPGYHLRVELIGLRVATDKEKNQIFEKKGDGS